MQAGTWPPQSTACPRKQPSSLRPAGVSASENKVHSTFPSQHIPVAERTTMLPELTAKRGWSWACLCAPQGFLNKTSENLRHSGSWAVEQMNLILPCP